jgi:Flp pilus assembly protein TadD
MEHKIPPAKDRISRLSEKKRLIVISLVLAVFTFIVYFQVTQNEFINLDDETYIINNKQIQNGLTVKGIIWAFTTGHAANWHPLTWISHMIDVQLFGLNPGGHHLINVLFHLANTVLLFFVLNRITQALWQSAFVAVLFALHPLHVESVAWASERKDVLSAFFWMLTMALYASYVSRPNYGRFLAVLLCFALGLMAKPMLITLPFVLLLLDYWPLRRLERNGPAQGIKPSLKKKKREEIPAISEPPDQPATTPWSSIRPLLSEKIPFFILAIFSSFITYFVQDVAIQSYKSFPLSVRLSNAFHSYLIYIVKMVWPVNLAVFYPHPGSWPTYRVLVSILTVILFTVQAFRLRKKYPYVFVGWSWYVGTLVPVIGIVQVGIQSMADRYTYLPLIGLFIIIAWGLPDILKTWPYRKRVLIALTACCFLGVSLLTWRQVGYWRNNLSLYNHTLSITKSNFPIHITRGQAFFKLGMINEAIADFNKAIEINPQYDFSYNNRGSIYRFLGNTKQAMRDFDRAIDLEPREILGYYNRGLTYILLGDYQQAIRDLNKVIELAPRRAEAYNSRGMVYSHLGNYAQAIIDIDKAIELDPEEAKAFNNRGMVYGHLGNFTEAIKNINKAIELDPKYADAYFNRGIFYHKLGNLQQVVSDLRDAARLGEKAAQNLLKKEGLDW